MNGLYACTRQRVQFTRRVWLELGLVALLFTFALAVRIPNFLTIPALTDEFKQVNWALDVYDGLRLPLIGWDSYTGPLFTYLLAFLFRLLGPSIVLPRLFVLIVGALTIIVTYYFGQALARGAWRVGALAAVLYASNAHHILFNSHVAWANDITPFFTTLTMLCYIVATRQNRPLGLIGAGALYGFAVQTHPSAVLLAPAFVIDFFLRPASRAFLRSPFPYLAGMAVLIAYSPGLYYNLRTGFDSLKTASASNVVETAPSLAQAVNNAIPQIALVGRAALGSFAPASTVAFFADPLLPIFLLVTLGALIWMARTGEIFPLIIFSTVMILLALFNRTAAIPDSARYIQFLLPVIFAAWGQAGIELWKRLSARGHIWRWVSGTALAVLFGGICVSSLLALDNYYAEMTAEGRDNTALVRMLETTRQTPATPVLVEWDLAKIRTGRGGNIADNLIYLMRLEQRKPTLVSVTTLAALGGAQNFLRDHPEAFFIGFADTPELLGTEFPLRELVSAHFSCPTCSVSNDFALYWWQEP